MFKTSIQDVLINSPSSIKCPTCYPSCVLWWKSVRGRFGYICGKCGYVCYKREGSVAELRRSWLPNPTKAAPPRVPPQVISTPETQTQIKNIVTEAITEAAKSYKEKTTSFEDRFDVVVKALRDEHDKRLQDVANIVAQVTNNNIILPARQSKAPDPSSEAEQECVNRFSLLEVD